MTDDQLNEKLGTLIAFLVSEQRQNDNPLDEITSIADFTLQERFDVFRYLVTIRQPWRIPYPIQALQDEVLSELIDRRGVFHFNDADVSPLDGRLRLWRGDITALEVDAIVNAANATLLGCRVPYHTCVDNAIHTFAGVQLRIACDNLIKEQGHTERTGLATLTPGFNLPSKYIIHTVGPIVDDDIDDQARSVLQSCYISCMDAAGAAGCDSLAFCCIGTGEFGFPKVEAARIALQTVQSWLDAHTGKDGLSTVIFTVYDKENEAIYSDLLEIKPPVQTSCFYVEL